MASNSCCVVADAWGELYVPLRAMSDKAFDGIIQNIST
jgi:hypothetical protein